MSSLTFTGSSAYSTTTKKFGTGSLVLAGTSSGTATGDNLPAGQFTVECWGSTTATGTIVLLSASNAFWIGIDSSGHAVCKYGSGGTEVSIDSSVVVNDGAFHHFAIAVGAGGGKFFVDGVLANSSATSYATAGGTVSAITIGKLGGSFFWTGNIDEIAVWLSLKYTATFSVPTSAYTGSEANLVNLWHLDSTGADAMSTAVIPPNHAAIVYSPYNWTPATADNTRTINAGAYFKTLLSGGTCQLLFDVTNNAAPLSEIYYRIDGYEAQTPWIKANVAGSITVTLPGDLTSAPYHLLEVMVKSTSETLSRWGTPSQTAVVFTGLVLGAGATLLAPTKSARNLLIYGDSITEGVRTVNATATNDTDRNDALLGWAYNLGRMLNCEVGVVGFGGQGWLGTNSLPSTYNLIMTGAARSFSPDPTAVFVNMGTNNGGDLDSDVQAAAQTFLTGILGATTASEIVIMRPFNGAKATALAAAVTANGNARAHYFDTTGVFDNSLGGDGLHPLGPNNLSVVTPKLANAMSLYVEPRRFNVTAA